MDWKLKIAMDPEATTEQLDQLFDHCDPFLDKKALKALAQHPHARMDILEKIALNDTVFSMDYVSDLVRNPQLDQKQIARWAKSDQLPLRIVAAHSPHLSEQDLLQLAADEEIEVRISIAAHPKTPAQILTQLFEQRGELQNARYIIQDIIDFQDTNYYEYELLDHIAAHPQAPEELLNQIAEASRFKYHHLNKNLAKNPNASIDLLYRLIKAFSHSLASNTLFGKKRSFYKIFKHPKIDLNQLKQWLDEGDVALKLFIIQYYPQMPAEWLIPLAYDSNIKIAQAVLEHPNIPMSILIEFADHPADELKQSVLKNLKTPEKIIGSLLQNADQAFKIALLKEHKLPKRIIRKLVLDQDDEVRKKAQEELGSRKPSRFLKELLEHELIKLKHKLKLKSNDDSVSVEQKTEPSPEQKALIEKLAQSDDPQVRCDVAGERETPTEILQSLAKDPDFEVRWAVANNSNLPLSQLEQMLLDDLELSLKLTHIESLGDLIWNRRIIPPLILDRLVDHHKDSRLKKQIARYFYTSSITLQKLAQDDDPEIRIIVARHFNTPIHMLKKLAQDKDPRVRAALAKNEKTPKSILEKLVQDKTVKALITEELYKMYKDEILSEMDDWSY